LFLSRIKHLPIIISQALSAVSLDLVPLQSSEPAAIRARQRLRSSYGQPLAFIEEIQRHLVQPEQPPPPATGDSWLRGEVGRVPEGLLSVCCYWRFPWASVHPWRGKLQAGRRAAVALLTLKVRKWCELFCCEKQAPGYRAQLHQISIYFFLCRPQFSKSDAKPLYMSPNVQFLVAEFLKSPKMDPEQIGTTSWQQNLILCSLCSIWSLLIAVEF